jgi:site-specific DNA recombinase
VIQAGVSFMSREKKIVVACYCRVSTDSGPQQSSFANQQSYFKDYLAASEKYKLYKIYADKGISGTLLHREYFDEMLIDAGLDIETVKSKSIQVQTISDTAKHKPSFATYKEYIVIPSDRPPKFTEILVRNTSRFARNVMIADILRKLLLKGVYVRFLDIDKTTEKPEDISFIQLFQNFDEMFSRDLSRKVRAGNERSVANKTVRSHPKLYGYKYTKRKNLNENNRLTLIPKEAEIVQKIYRLYAGCFSPDEAAFIGCNFKCSECDIKRSAGVGKRAIIKYLIENGKFTRGNKEFGTTTISNILRNEKYFGYINTGKYDTGELFNKNKFSKIREDYLLEPDPTNIDPIVSMELFNLCQSNRKERYDYVKSTGLPPTSSLYGGLLVCGTCGYKYLHNKDKDTGFYQCGLKKRKGVSACNSANVSEKIVAEYMQRLACGGISIELYQDRQDMVITLWVAVSKKLAFIGRNRSPKELQSLQEQLSSLEKELRTGYDMLMREKGDHTMLEKMIQEKKEALFSVQEQIDKRTKKPKIYLEESRTLIEYAYEILNELETRTKELTKRTYTADEVRTMIECITVYGETSPNGGKASSVLLKPKLKISEMVKDIIYKEEKDKEEYEQTPENIETVTLFPASGLKQEIDELAIKLEALELQYF